MAVTRIKNNQITDATITGSKFVEKTITGGLLSDNLTYGSNLIVSGNLTINGTTTTVDTTNTVVADPLLVLSRGETSTPSKDSGIIIERGTSDNVGFIWDESADVFAAISTAEDGTTAGNVTIIGYANFKAADIEGSSLSIDNIDIDGNTISSTDTNGNINIVPNGTGDIFLGSDTITVGDSNTNVTVTTNGTGDLVLNTNSGTNSGSITIADGVNGNISLTPNGSGQVVASNLAISNLTSGRVVLAGTSGSLNDSANLTFDGTLLTTTNLTVDNINVDANTITTSSGNLSLSSAGGEVTASSLAVSDLTSGRITYASTSGALIDNANLTFDGSTLTVTGIANVSSNLNVSGEATLSSATVSDLTSTRITYAGTSGSLVDSANLTFSGTLLTTTNLSVDNVNIDANTVTTTSGNLSLTSVGGEVTASSLAVSDLTSGCVTYASTDGSLVDSANLTFSGTLLTTTNLTVDNINVDGNTIISTDTNGNINITPNGAGEVIVSTIAIADLTSGRVPYVTTNDAITDSANLTFDGTLLTTTNLTVDNINVDGNTIVSTNTNGNINITPNGAGEVILSTLAVTDLTSGRVPYVTTNDAITDSANLTFNGTTLTVTGNVTVDNITIDGDTISSAHTIITIDPSTAGAGGTVVIQGNLEVKGTTTTIDSTVVTIVDPVFQLGADASNDNLDRGIKALYNSSGAKIAFFGRDDSTSEFIYINDATDTSSVFTGSLGSAAFGSLRVTDLTDNRVLVAGTSGEIEDSANLTFNGTLLTTTNLTVDNINVDANTITTSSGNLSLSSAGGEVSASSLAVSDLTSGRVTYASTSGALVDSANLTFDGTDLTMASAIVSDLTSTRITYAGTSGALVDSANLTFSGTLLTTTNLSVDNVNIDANTITTTSGNLSLSSAGGEVTASSLAVSDLTSGRVTYASTDGSLVDSANLTFSGTLLTTTNLSVDNINIDGNTIISTDTNGNINITPNGAGEVIVSTLAVTDLTSGRVPYVTTNDAITDSANFTYNGTTLTVTGNVVIDNITVDGNSISSSNALTLDAAASRSIVINESGADVDVRIESDTEANAFFVEGSTGNIGIRTATPNAGAALHINTTNSMIVPTGGTGDRPGTGVAGMVRFNTTTNNFEFFDGAEWVGTGSDFTIFTVDDFNGDGSTVAFTLSKDATSAGVIIALNGVVQDPGTAYSISGTTLTFTEAPANGDNIDVRILTTTAAVTEIADLNTSFKIEDVTETATTTINGNVVVTVTNAAVVPGANVTYDLGTSSLRWKDLWLSGTTLALGNLRIKDNSGSLAVFGSDGTTPAATALPSITKSGSNGVGDIGQSDNTFATVYATTFSGVSTTAKYADLAENYTADQAIEPATVVCFGGSAEVTVCNHDADRRVAGVVSTNPAHLMNADCVGEHVVAIALQGRVPCRVVGTVRKGDMMVSAGNGAARAEAEPKLGSVIGKALENFDGESGIIEVLVGRV